MGWGILFFYFELAFTIGDTSGQDAMCCHYQSYSKNSKCMCRDCDVSHEACESPLIDTLGTAGAGVTDLGITFAGEFELGISTKPHPIPEPFCNMENSTDPIYPRRWKSRQSVISAHLNRVRTKVIQ